MHKVVQTGEILVTSEECYISAIANRNVVVILWNHSAQSVGVCNYTVPAVYASSMATACYGNVALPQVIRLLKDRIGRKMEAYIFGGTSLGDNDLVGDENIEMAKRVLQAHFIPIASCSIGGKMAREVSFNTKTGECAVVKVRP